MYVSLGTIESVKKFVTKITEFNEDFELIGGKYIVDAKSILGIFSIDLSKPVLLRINAEGDRLEEIKEAVKEFTAYGSMKKPVLTDSVTAEAEQSHLKK